MFAGVAGTSIERLVETVTATASASEVAVRLVERHRRERSEPGRATLQHVADPSR